jgi:outer membrane protein assembly factor BamB
LAMAGVAAAVIAPGVSGRGATAQSAADWPGLQGGAGHIGGAVASFSPPLQASWRVAPSGDARLSTPAVSGTLAVSTGRTSVVGFDPTSGEVLWADVRRAEGLVVPPAIDLEAGAGGVVVFLEGNGPDDSKVVGIDPAERSSRLWETPLNAQSRTAPTVTDGRVFVGTAEGSVEAVEINSGTEAWTVKVTGEVATSPAVTEGRVFLVAEDRDTGRTRLYALDAEDGRVVWSSSPPGITLGVSSPTAADGTVYVGFGDYGAGVAGTVRAFDAASGALRWTQPVRGPFSGLSTLAFADGGVFVLDGDGGVYRLDGESGKPAWDYQFPSLVTWGAPLVAGRYVYVGLDDGTIAAIDAESGHLVWQTSLRQGAIGAFAPHGDLLLAPAIGLRGGIVAFEHDPDRPLLDIHSPTELNLARSLANLVAGSAVVMALMLGLFRVVLPRVGRTRDREAVHAEEVR